MRTIPQLYIEEHEADKSLAPIYLLSILFFRSLWKIGNMRAANFNKNAVARQMDKV